MSAADLFNAPYDAEFRLKGTYILIGRTPYYVRNVVPDGAKIENTILVLQDMKDEETNVRLGQLPLNSMTACPSGYCEGMWHARGPARHRYQGITSSSFWVVMPNGMVETGAVAHVKKLMKELPLQPRTRRPGKRPSGALTRDVFVGPGGQVLIRGRLRGEYLGENLIKPLGDLSPLSQTLLNNAKLGVINTPTEALAQPDKDDMMNPCAEIIL